MQGVEDGQKGSRGEGLVKRAVFMKVLESAVHICIIAHVCSHLMNIVFRL
jgi:hypothetical protein